MSRLNSRVPAAAIENSAFFFRISRTADDRNLQWNVRPKIAMRHTARISLPMNSIASYRLYRWSCYLLACAAVVGMLAPASLLILCALLPRQPFLVWTNPG